MKESRILKLHLTKEEVEKLIREEIKKKYPDTVEMAHSRLECCFGKDSRGYTCFKEVTLVILEVDHKELP